MTLHHCLVTSIAHSYCFLRCWCVWAMPSDHTHGHCWPKLSSKKSSKRKYFPTFLPYFFQDVKPTLDWVNQWVNKLTSNRAKSVFSLLLQTRCLILHLYLLPWEYPQIMYLAIYRTGRDKQVYPWIKVRQEYPWHHKSSHPLYHRWPVVYAPHQHQWPLLLVMVPAMYMVSNDKTYIQVGMHKSHYDQLRKNPDQWDK